MVTIIIRIIMIIIIIMMIMTMIIMMIMVIIRQAHRPRIHLYQWSLTRHNSLIERAAAAAS